MWDLWWTKWAGAGFLRVIRFTLSIFIPQISPQKPSGVWYNRTVNGCSAQSNTPLIKKKKEVKMKIVKKSNRCKPEYKVTPYPSNEIIKGQILKNNIYKFSSYLTENTLRLRYRDQRVNAV
jgi:hypothetical protein